MYLLLRLLTVRPRLTPDNQEYYVYAYTIVKLPIALMYIPR